MNLQEVAKEFNRLMKSEQEIKLEDKITELEKIIENLCDRLEYLEKHQCQ